MPEREAYLGFVCLLRKKCVRRVVLPPSGVTALVEFGEPQEARSAFKKLAYTMFMDQPLYLEWAPVNVFSREATADESTRPSDEANNDSRIDSDAAAENTGEPATQKVDENSNAEPEEGSVLFVKNLNFSTTNDALRQVGFQKPIRSFGSHAASVLNRSRRLFFRSSTSQKVEALFKPPLLPRRTPVNRAKLSRWATVSYNSYRRMMP